ncbi:hypothetical protein H2203_003031 [Taxawa tesnikishii (nom. ined.)]|nr:hypothetical protein H2203_003031 [Dothideales sp. JES 119]
MGGGGGKPLNIFTMKRGDEPKEVFNWRLWFAVFSFGIMGAARGIDEGLISGTFNTKNFQKALHFDELDEVALANVKGNVSAMVQIGSVAGAGLAFLLADRIGRLWATRQLCLMWILGIVIFLTNGGRLGQVYAGRFIAGLGIGQTTVIAPVYISEIAPKSVRGLCTCVFAGSARVRGLPRDHYYVTDEINEIQHQLHEEQEATLGQGFFGYLKEMFLMPNNFYRIYLGLGSQLLSQWSGAQSITIYAPDFFALLGTKGQNEKLFATAIFGVVKFVAAIACALFLVDYIGRKRSLSIGIGLQAISMAYIAAFLTAVPTLGEGEEFTTAQKHASTGAIVMIYLSGFGWAMGWNSIQYLLNAEIYPLRIRAMSSSLVMCFHFVNQYGNSRAVPSMLLDVSDGGLSPKGTFWLFTAITIIGGVWAWFFIPETAGRSLEGMDELFKLPWYRIGRYGQREAEISDQFAAERHLEEKQAAGVERVEVATKV